MRPHKTTTRLDLKAEESSRAALWGSLLVRC